MRANDKVRLDDAVLKLCYFGQNKIIIDRRTKRTRRNEQRNDRSRNEISNRQCAQISVRTRVIIMRYSRPVQYIHVKMLHNIIIIIIGVSSANRRHSESTVSHCRCLASRVVSARTCCRLISHRRRRRVWPTEWPSVCYSIAAFTQRPGLAAEARARLARFE